MKRTRKWAFVAQEAIRLANLGLSPLDIAERLELNRATVQRWMAAGKLTDTRQSVAARSRVEILKRSGQTPDGWASAVRQDYALDVTDDQLVTLAEAALRTARDPTASIRVQLSAMGRFQAIVKQLALVPREVDAPTPLPPAPEEPPMPRERRADPRAALMKEPSTIQ
jgi:hypothetical protein